MTMPQASLRDYPFGLLMPGRDYQSGKETKEKFTGKELDSETGWIHFPARPYLPSLGKWLTVDPLMEKYASWNPYIYTFANPINFYDSNGEWSKRIHNLILDRAFSGILTSQQIQILKDASVAVDEDQSFSGAYKHAMRQYGETVEEAENKMNEFVTEKLVEFIHSEREDEAYFALGQALHPLMDLTSPAHTGFQPWGPPQTMPGAIVLHFLMENFVSPFDNEKRIRQTVEIIRKKYQEAMKIKREREKERDALIRQQEFESKQTPDRPYDQNRHLRRTGGVVYEENPIKK